ncbi:MAG: hypothetical protein BWX86_02288 [Verrucomicrobia bacterium ADurb.Bin122]|nr:MAG: hypothetical protein BWX86_02288 [Verrucomicrobia bacterium ADurb.Bin122]
MARGGGARAALLVGADDERYLVADRRCLEELGEIAPVQKHAPAAALDETVAAVLAPFDDASGLVDRVHEVVSLAAGLRLAAIA